MSVQSKRKTTSEIDTVPKSSAGNSTTDGAKQDSTPSIGNLREQIQAQFKHLEGKSQAKKSSSKKSKEIAKPSLDAAQDIRGKKRDSNGTVLGQAKRSQEDSIKLSSPTPPDNELLEEIKALGGTSEDLELFADAPSDSEFEGEGQNKPQKTQNKAGDIQKGISNILKEIALSQGVEEDSGDSASELDNDIDQKQSVVDTVIPPSTKTQDRSSTNKKNSLLRCEPRPDWFILAEDQGENTANTKYTPSLATLEVIHTFAHNLLEEENENFRKFQHSSSQSFYNTVIASGTLSDKISALTLAVQESPLHNIKALETLVGLSQKRNRSQAVDVLRALKDLLAQGSLLPSDRRIYTFTTHPAMLSAFGTIKSWKEGDKLPKGVREEHLICWAFESWLKEQYFEVLKTLEIWCNDEIEFSKARAISYVYELLKEKPEQESNLLRLLINKLGDPMKKIASQTSYLLMQLLSVHPAMKSVVISAIESDFIFRPGQSLHGKYYAVVTINQTALSSKEEDVAIKLLGIYFGLFTSLLNTSKSRKPTPKNTDQVEPETKKGTDKAAQSGEAQSEELREKLTSAILTGVNRAYPYAGSDYRNFEQHLETLFKIAHSANFNTSIQALLLIQQLSSSHQPSSDRFYRVLYESLLDPRLINASKQQMYLNLLHRALKADLNMKRLKAFIKRILQVLVLHEPSFICGVFFLLKDLEKSSPSLRALVDSAEDHENDEEVFRDIIEEGDEDRVAPVNGAESTSTLYDAHKRAPEHANADNTCAWEILPFLAHFHPSVSLSAHSYLQHNKLPGKADLSLHTLIHFLDRFVYRNAKLSDTKLRGSSIMQPMATDNAHATLINRTTGGLHRLPVNSDSFRQKKDTEVAAEDVFFHKYFSNLGKEQNKKSKRRERDVEFGDIGNEDAVWKAMMNSAPDLEGANSDDDLSMSDLESGSDVDMEDAMDQDAESAEEDVDGEGVDIEPGIFDESDDDLVELDDQDEAPALEAIESENEAATVQAPKRDKKVNKTKEQRKKMKALPTFASAADYAKMLDDEEDEDLG